MGKTVYLKEAKENLFRNFVDLTRIGLRLESVHQEPLHIEKYNTEADTSKESYLDWFLAELV